MANADSPPPPAPRIDRARLARALAKARAALLAERGPHGHWEGELSSSALSTATAVTALELWQRHASERPAVSGQRSAIEAGLKWLAEHQNTDGGWGDTTLSFSNISTTALCWAAFGAVPGAEARWPEVVRRAEAWLAGKCSVISNQCSDPTATASAAPTENWTLNTEHSALNRADLITAIIARYGKDRTFSVPILTMCALAGRLGEGKEAWRRVIQLPFELAALPHKFFAALRLPVVSYALPALIAIGQVRHHHLPTRNPLTRLLRNRTRAKTLRVLERIQPPGGGFLEATPLTSFVTMSLAGSGQADHPVAQRGVEFLLKSMRADGSWPIDTNLATWVTTLAVNALGPSIHDVMSAEERGRILDWLLAQQYRTVHPYTNAAPGGWAWTDLPGGVPDADDTAGALLALKVLSECGMRNAECGMKSPPPAAGENEHDAAPVSHSAFRTPHSALFPDPRVRAAAIAGVKWLLDLQNRDGGIPTFCRGWTNLPFDRSSPDITAHALRAWLAWESELPKSLRPKRLRALNFLLHAQEFVGSWLPLWFGNQHVCDEGNRTYGTAQVVKALACTFESLPHDTLDPETAAKLASNDWLPLSQSTLGRLEQLRTLGEAVTEDELPLTVLRMLRSGHLGLYFGQRPEGGAFSAGARLEPMAPASVEETALALEAVATLATAMRLGEQALRISEREGLDWLLARVEDGTWTQPAPIGFYFAKLWYYERLYPMVFTVAALEAVARLEATDK